MDDTPKIIPGGVHIDQRGKLKYFNELDLGPIKRFYVSEHSDTAVVRAWQGHKKESKWFFVLTGAFKVIVVKPDNWDAPSAGLCPVKFILDTNKNEILYIPGGYATGFQAMSPNASLMIFSDFLLEESLADDYRFERDLWYKW